MISPVKPEKLPLFKVINMGSRGMGSRFVVGGLRVMKKASDRSGAPHKKCCSLKIFNAERGILSGNYNRRNVIFGSGVSMFPL